MQSEHAQPVDGERDDERKDERKDEATEKKRPEDGRDLWRAGQREDLSAGDEGVDDPAEQVEP